MSTWHVLNYSKEEQAKSANEPVDKKVSLQVLKRCLNIQTYQSEHIDPLKGIINTHFDNLKDQVLNNG